MSAQKVNKPTTFGPSNAKPFKGIGGLIHEQEDGKPRPKRNVKKPSKFESFVFG